MSSCLTDSEFHRLHSGEMSPADAKRAADHVAECDACRTRDAELLRIHDELADNLRAALTIVDAPTAEAPSTEPYTNEPSPAVAIGDYRLLQKLGEGGMGIVYLAEQQMPRRKVALKIIKPGMDSKAVLARFEAERQALALMDHPNVARVYNAGVTEAAAGARPYFVMEHVAGVPITEHCDRYKLSIEERLHLFMQVCEAIQHAHQKGVIHRDIKPSNILVSAPTGAAEVFGKSGRTRSVGVGTPKVIDFGVAKAIAQPLTERTLFTEQGQFIGTPAYMSPEQAGVSGQDIDTRSDIYSLGVLLYELLTGSLPFDIRTLRNAAFDEMLRIIREVEPQKPSTRLEQSSTRGNAPPVENVRDPGVADPQPGPGQTKRFRQETGDEIARRRTTNTTTLVRRVRGDLDWIVMKCLEKDRRRRYETANELAADILRYLCFEPVIAGPPSVAYRWRKFVRRNRVPVIAAALVAAAVVFGLIGTTWGVFWALKERDRAEGEARFARLAEADERVAREEADSQRREAELQRSEAETNARITKALNDFLIDEMLISADPKVAVGRSITVEEVVEAAARRVDQLTHEPKVEASIRHTLGRVLFRLGDSRAAELHLRRAIELRSEHLGPEHPDTLRSDARLSHVLWDTDRFKEAEALARRTWKSLERILGASHSDTLYARRNYCVSLLEQDMLDEAEACLSEVLGRSNDTLGPDHPHTLLTRTNLALAFERQDKLDKARDLYDRNLRTQKATLDSDHPDIATTLFNLSVAHAKKGRLALAEETCAESLAIRRRVLAADHPHLGLTLAHLGAVLGAQGKLADAESTLREAIALMNKAGLDPSSAEFDLKRVISSRRP